MKTFFVILFLAAVYVAWTRGMLDGVIAKAKAWLKDKAR